MKSLLLVPALAAALSVPFAAMETRAPQDPQDPVRAGGQPDMAAMMAKMKAFTTPGPEHEVLERFLGTWTMESSVMGQPPEKSEVTWSWLMEGRWLQSHAKGQMMGQPIETASWMGYDRFKQSYVMTFVNTMDTAMLRAEGDLTRDGRALIAYGTLDEYLTGEHDKMVKYVWRFVSDDEIVQDIHDLPIGEENTKVVEIRYRRKG